MTIITRKIQLNVTNADKKEAYAKLYEYKNIVFQAANLISTHKFCLENIKQFFYLTDETKVKIADVKKDEQGILTTSNMNATYQLCSSIYKSKIPMSIITSLNSQIVRTFNKEKKDYFTGKRSLRSYRNTIPIPIRTQDIKVLKYNNEIKNFDFHIYDFQFQTYLGADKSGNKQIIDRCISGEYKLCDSSIKIERKNNKTQIYLLLTCQFTQEKKELNPDNICEAELSFNTPVILKYKNKTYEVGNTEDYVYKRMQIQGKLIRLQKQLKFNNGGHGRKLKLQALEQFKLKEKNYVDNILHNYSRQIINYCIKNECGTLRLNDVEAITNELKEEENKFILRNWTYYGFLDKIKYKAEHYGINVQVC